MLYLNVVSFFGREAGYKSIKVDPSSQPFGDIPLAPPHATQETKPSCQKTKLPHPFPR